MWVLFVPLLVVLLLVGVLATLFAGVAWLLGAGWPWLLIVLGAWLFWHEDGRHHERRRVVAGRAFAAAARGPAGSPSGSPGAPRSTHPPSSPADSRAAPKDQPRIARAARQAELPIDVQVKVEQIRRKVDVLLGYADRFPPFSQDLYLVRQTASEYLPRTINAYLALSREAAEKPLSADGKTAHQELKSQLDLLDARLDEIAQDLQRRDADRLLANRRFLETRFGHRNDGFDVA